MTILFALFIQKFCSIKNVIEYIRKGLSPFLEYQRSRTFSAEAYTRVDYRNITVHDFREGIDLIVLAEA